MKTKNKILVSLGTIIVLGLLLHFAGVFSILFVSSDYSVGDGLTFTTSSSQGSSYYQGCKMNILYDGNYVECTTQGYLCGSGNYKSTCYNTQVIRLTEADIGTRTIGVEYKGCTCKVNPTTGVCEQLLTPYGFSESKTIRVNAVASSITCPSTQNLVNGVCVAKPCTYTNGNQECVSGNFITYTCYNKNTQICGSQYTCSSTKGCILKPTPEPVVNPQIIPTCSKSQQLINNVCQDVVIPIINDTVVPSVIPPTPPVEKHWYDIFVNFWNWLINLFKVN